MTVLSIGFGILGGGNGLCGALGPSVLAIKYLEWGSLECRKEI
jgi:hypothetical protein